MVRRATYTLKVLYQPEEHICSFLLLWNGGQRDLYVGQPYPDKVLKEYEDWKSRYLRYYQLSSNQNFKRGGSIATVLTGDDAQDLRTLEEKFLITFHQWLGEGNVRAIEKQIQAELFRLSQDFTINEMSDSGAIAPGASVANFYQVDIRFACDDIKLQQLPWESWVAHLVPEQIPPGTIRLIRTTKDGTGYQRPSPAPMRLRKTRILGILGDDSNLSVDKDLEHLKSLSAIADVERVTWHPNASAHEIVQIVFKRIQDDRGWDILFFAGHSDDVVNPNGTFTLSPTVTLAMNDLKEHIEQACNNGLQVAIFNSCSGLRIADSLVRMGIQAVVMRERVRSDVAVRFLEFMTHHLLEFDDIHTALLKACQELRSLERIRFPSAHLLPSFFSPPNQLPYYIKTIGLKHRIKRWLPNRRESIALGVIVLLSQMIPIQDLLLDVRHLSQAVYRHATQQGVETTSTPPVQIVAINQASINQASETEEYPDFQTVPIERQYLADIIQAVTQLKAEIIGVDYLLHESRPRQELLAESIRKAVELNEAWVVIGVDPKENFFVHRDTASSSWSLQGDMLFYNWLLQYPTELPCQKICPFAYTTSMSHYLTQEMNDDERSTLNLVPNLSGEGDFQAAVDSYLARHNGQSTDIPFLHRDHWTWGGDYLIDFSVPPSQIYQRVSSGALLNEGLSETDLTSQVVLIGAGGYEDSEDKYSLPLSTRYWRRVKPRTSEQEFPAVMTGVEIHAYMAHHFLEKHLIASIPTIWLLGVAAIVGRSTTFYMLEQRATSQQKKILLLMIFGAGLISLQLYISARIAIPWLFPSSLFVMYTLPIFRRKPDV